MMKNIFITLLFMVTFFKANCQISYTIKNPTPCSSNGKIQLQVSGYFEPYTYLWNDGTTKSYAENLKEGKYSVSITDNTCCQVVKEFELKATFISKFKILTPPCNGQLGKIKIETENKDIIELICTDQKGAIYPSLKTVGNYEISNLPNGTYKIRIIDTHGCQSTDEIQLSDKIEINSHVTYHCGTDLCSIDLDVKPEQADYTYLWNNHSTLPNIIYVKNGDYNVVVSNSSGCFASHNVTTSNYKNLTFTIKDISGSKYNSGKIDYFIDGNFPIKIYSYPSKGSYILDKSGVYSISNLPTGKNVIYITDEKGCREIVEIDIPDLCANADIKITSTTKSETKKGDKDGIATFNISGGTIPYSWTIYGPTAFKLDGIGAIASANNLEAGNYTIIVYDFNGCGRELTRKVISCDKFNIEEDLKITPIITSTCPINISFDYPAKGVQGLKETYFIPQDIKLIHPKTGEEYITREKNDYCIEISSNPDGAICGLDLDDPNEVLKRYCYTVPCGTVDFDSDLSSCDEKGELYVTTNGLCEPITYIWSNSDVNVSDVPVNPSIDKIVQVSVIDRNGCKYEHTYNFDILESGNLSGGCGEPFCYTFNTNGLLNGPFNFEWQLPDDGGVEFNESGQLCNLIQGAYTVKITDKWGCNYEKTFYVPGQTKGIEANYTVIPEDLFMDSKDGTIEVTIKDIVTPFDYYITNYNGFHASETGLSSTVLNFDGLHAGIYYLFLKGDDGCTKRFTIEVFYCKKFIPELELKMIDVTQEQVTNNPQVCKNKVWGASFSIIDKYKAELNIKGGLAPYTYVLTKNGGHPKGQGVLTKDDDITTFDNLGAGSYLLTIKDNESCYKKYSITIIENPDKGTEVKNDKFWEIKEIVTHISAFCTGGSIKLTNVGAFGKNTTFVWTGPNGFKANTKDIVDLKVEGEYSVMVTYGECGKPVHIKNIKVEKEKDIIFQIRHICATDDKGCVTFDLSKYKDLKPFSFKWEGNTQVNNSEICGLDVGRHDIIITPSQGCPNTQAITIKAGNIVDGRVEILKNETQSNISKDGSAKLVVSGSGSLVVNYEVIGDNYFKNGQLTQFGVKELILNNLHAGKYQAIYYVGNDKSVCPKVVEFEIFACDSPIDFSNTQIKHINNCEKGGIILDIPQQYLENTQFIWEGDKGSKFVKTPPFTNLFTFTEDKYCLTIKGEFCDNPFPKHCFELKQLDCGLSIDLVKLQNRCGNDNGSIEVEVESCYHRPFTMQWSNGGNSDKISDLAVGKYTLVVNSDSGCKIEKEFEIKQSSSPKITDVLPFYTNGTTGNLKALIDGNVPLTYVLKSTTFEKTGIITQNGWLTIMDIPFGVYTLEVFDNFSCKTIINDININGCAKINVSNCGVLESVVSIDLSGNFKFAWSDGITNASNSRNDLPAGKHNVLVTDLSNGETCSIEFELFELKSNIKEPCSLEGEYQGYIELESVPGLTFKWLSTSTTGNTLPVSSAGKYTVRITNSKTGCITTKEFNMNTFDADDIKVTSKPCKNGEVTVSFGRQIFVQGTGIKLDGKIIAQYWTGESIVLTSSNKTGILEFYDSQSGCTIKKEINFNNYEPLSITLSSAEKVCKPFEPKIIATISPFSDNLLYTWNNGKVGKDLNKVTIEPNKQINLVITDKNGCTSSSSNFIFSDKDFTPIPTLSLNGLDPCGDVNNGIVNCSIENPSSYSYIWDNGAKTQNISNLANGTFSVTVSSINYSCTATATTSIKRPIYYFESVCPKLLDGIAAVLFNGVNTKYEWSNGVSGTAQLSNLSAGIYCVNVSDSRPGGCSFDKCFNVNNLPITCEDECKGKKIANPKLDALLKISNFQDCSNGLGSITFSFKQNLFFELLDFSGNIIEKGNAFGEKTMSGLKEGKYKLKILLTNGDCDELFYNFEVKCCTSGKNPIELLNFAVTPKETTISGGSIILDVNRNDVNYNWEGPNGFSSLSKNLLNITMEGEYCVTISGSCSDNIIKCFTLTNLGECNKNFSGISFSSKGACPELSCQAGSLTLVLNNSQNDYSFIWKYDGSSNPTLNNLKNGSYQVDIKHKKTGCKNVLLGEVPALNETRIGPDNNCQYTIKCGENCDGKTKIGGFNYNGIVEQVDPEGKNCLMRVTCLSGAKIQINFNETNKREYEEDSYWKQFYRCGYVYDCTKSGFSHKGVKLEHGIISNDNVNCQVNKYCQLPGSFDKKIIENGIYSGEYCYIVSSTSFDDITFFYSGYLYKLCNSQKLLPAIDSVLSVSTEYLARQKWTTNPFYKNPTICPSGFTEDDANSKILSNLTIEEKDINKRKIKTIELYPNPFIDVININIDLFERESFDVSVFNSLGSKIYNEDIDLSSGLNKFNIAPVGLTNGLYYIELKTKDGSTFKFKMINIK